MSEFRAIDGRPIGRAVLRREDEALVRGVGRFVDDLMPEGCLHLCFVRSAHPSGRLLSVDADAVRADPATVLVLTGSDCDGLGRSAINPILPNLQEHPPELLARARVAHVGQPIAAVVAADRRIAADLCDGVLVDVAVEPAEAVEALDRTWSRGDAPTALAEADHVVEVTVDHQRVAPMALEPRAALASFDAANGALTVWLSTQTPHRARADLARILHLDPDRIRVVAPDVGGAFGGKASIYPEDAVVALAALRTGRPVKWTASRSEEFLAATHGRGGRLRGRLGVTKDGRFVALEVDGRFDLGAWMTFSAAVPARNAGRILPGPYDIPHVHVRTTASLSPRAPIGIYRGAGRPEAAMIMERLVEAAARRLGLDALDLRRRNVHPAGALPRDTTDAERFDASDLPGLTEDLAAGEHHRALRRLCRQARERGLLAGVGSALYLEPCGNGWESARIGLSPDGDVVLATGSTAQGQGRDTAAAQIAAAVLPVPADRIRVVHGDTAATPEGIGALASRSTPIGGSAITLAARQFLERAAEKAAKLLKSDAGSVAAGAAGFACRRSGATLTWAMLAAAHAAELEVGVRYEPDGEAWASGIVSAAVSIDRETGTPEVLGIVWIDDAGTVVNPMLLNGQLVGGAAQGLGEALMERVVYDAGGQLLTGSLMDYQVPRADDMPPVTILGRPVRSRMNLLGAKGAGEAGCIGIPAAVANAVHDALSAEGIADVQMPFTAARLWTLIHRTSNDRDPT